MKSLGDRLTQSAQHFLHAFHLFSYRQKIVFLATAFVFIASSGALAWSLNQSLTVLVPAHGGSFSEGVLGVPRFINPLLALSDADRDLSILVYSGLMRIGEDGTPVPDLAESYEISDDGLTYTFTLREATWHDKTAVTADDVVFTIEKAKDPAIKSPKRASWEGVEVAALDSKRVVFTLRHAYGGFLENTTLGILPRHIWGSVDAESFPFHEANTKPIGTGPYFVDEIRKDSSSVPTQYVLRAWRDYTLGMPYIRSISLRFYPNQEELVKAYENGTIQSVAALPSETAVGLHNGGKTVIRSNKPLPRIFGIFFNQNENRIFADSAVRSALSVSIDRAGIIRDVLHGYAEPISGPLPPGVLGAQLPVPANLGEARFDEARLILEKGGWIFDDESKLYKKTTKANGTQWLEFSLATVDTPELKAVAEAVVRDWQKLGVKTTLNIFEIGDLNQKVIRPRKYDALFFGEIVGRDPDPFAFWASSERNDPGLNIALYANASVDKLLAEARSETDKQLRGEKYAEFEKIVVEDVPAAFVYSPYFLYVTSPNIHGITLGGVAAGSDRFLSVRNWYIEQDRVWKIFTSASTTPTN